MKIDDTDFVLFDVAPRFAQDRAALDARWKALQAQVHPDRFVAQGAAAQHEALQWALRVNEAYQRLKDPLARAVYLCKLNGHDVHAETHSAMPVDFLMQQMAWREALAEAATPECIETLGDEVNAQRQVLQDKLAAAIDERADWPAAAAHVRALMFMARFAQDIDQRLDSVG